MARRAINIEVAPRTLIWALVAAAGAWLLLKLGFVLVLVVISLILAGTIYPLVAWLERRRVPRSIALVAAFILLIGVVGLLAFVTLPPLIAQLITLVEKAPEIQANLATRLAEHPSLRSLARTVKDARVAGLFALMGQHLLDFGSRLVVFLGEALTSVFLALYIIGGREREEAALFALVPRRHHVVLARILKNLATIVGGYVRGQLLTSALIAAFVFVLLSAMEVNNALAIAVLAGLTDVIPFIGGLLAMTPAVLATAGEQGLPSAAVVFVVLVLYQEFESRILVPRVYGRVLRLSPVMVIVSLLIGGTVAGVVGALLALPVAAAIRMIIRELRVDLPGDDVDHSADARRDAVAQQVFETVTAGAPPERAAEVAHQIAETMTDESPR